MGFSAIDYAVLLLYLAGITIFGVMAVNTTERVWLPDADRQIRWKQQI